jgi:hypothetical protein
MIDSKPVEYTSEARWRAEPEPVLTEPEQSGETEPAPTVNSGSGNVTTAPNGSRNRRRRRTDRRTALPSYMGAHIDFYA